MEAMIKNPKKPQDRNTLKCGQWKDLGSASELAEENITLNRNYLIAEIEFSKRVKIRDCNRFRDSRPPEPKAGFPETDLEEEIFENVLKSQLSQCTQTHLIYTEHETQTHPGRRKTAWTQHNLDSLDELFKIFKCPIEEVLVVKSKKVHVVESEEKKVTKKIKEKKVDKWSRLQDFLNVRIGRLNEMLIFNAVMNSYVDDVSKLNKNIEGPPKDDLQMNNGKNI